MDTILDTKKLRSPQEVMQELEDKQIKRGDKIIILTEEAEFALISLMMAIVSVLAESLKAEKQKKVDFGDRVLSEIFDLRRTSKEIEAEIEEKYGISIEVIKEEDQFRENWSRLAVQNLERAYGEDEPDYSEIQVKEPNPEFKKSTAK